MLKFKSFLKEDLLLEVGGSGASADSKGKLRELGVGYYLHGGKHMESYRAEGKTPAEIFHIHSEKLHGKEYKKSAAHKKFMSNSKGAADHISAALNHYGYGDIQKAVWTSQPSDHESETKVKDANNSADHILTMNKPHSRSHGAETKIALSIKTGSGNVNYDNPGVESLAKLSKNKKVNDHANNHRQTVESLLPAGKGDAHVRYKALRDSTKKSDQAKAAKIKESSDKANNMIGSEFRNGLAKQSHEELVDTIKNSVAPPTHLKHLVSREITHDKTGEVIGHHTYDLHSHVHEYLDHFKDLHANPNDKSNSVTIYGTHKKTGAKMAVARWAIYAGGRPASTPRASTTLPSEDHKDMKYTEFSEHAHQK
jgi:hypothetical protein